MKNFLFIVLLFAAIAVNGQNCSATTKAGTQCSRKATTAGMCWQHSQPKAPENAKSETFQCSGFTKAGARCRNRSKNQFCHLHNK